MELAGIGCSGSHPVHIGLVMFGLNIYILTTSFLQWGSVFQFCKENVKFYDVMFSFIVKVLLQHFEGRISLSPYSHPD